jgi:hypothetical protein
MPVALSSSSNGHRKDHHGRGAGQYLRRGYGPLPRKRPLDRGDRRRARQAQIVTWTSAGSVAQRFWVQSSPQEVGANPASSSGESANFRSLPFSQAYSTNPELARMDRAHHAERVSKAMTGVADPGGEASTTLAHGASRPAWIVAGAYRRQLDRLGRSAPPATTPGENPRAGLARGVRLFIAARPRRRAARPRSPGNSVARPGGRE